MANEKNFSIRETVNKNIERVQFPAFNNHRSLIGTYSNKLSRLVWNELSKGPNESTIHGKT